MEMDFKKLMIHTDRIVTRSLHKAFYSTLGRLNHFSSYSPDIHIIGDSEKVMKEAIAEYRRNRDGELTFLEIGARDAKQRHFSEGFTYFAIDILPKSECVIVGDICHCPEIEDNSFDITFSMDVLEHVDNPFDAAKECIRITKPGGLLVHRTLFSYRYHPSPNDYWRFTSQGLEKLFVSSGNVETVLKGYDIRDRRRNRKGKGITSRPPIDWMGGFRENWLVLWIGRVV